MLGALAAIIVKLMYVQLFSEIPEPSKNAYRVRIKEVPLVAPRGLIYDRNGKVLAKDVLTYDLVADLSDINDPNLAGNAYNYWVLRDSDRRWASRTASEQNNQVIGRTHAYLKADSWAYESRDISLTDRYKQGLVRLFQPFLLEEKESFLKKLEGKKDNQILIDTLSDVSAEKLDELITEHRLVGLKVRKNYKRLYTYGKRAAHVIGFVNPNHEGQSGVERSMDSTLSGQIGYTVYHLDKNNKIDYTKPSKNRVPVSGRDVKLTLDIDLQGVVEDALLEGVEMTKAVAGTAIVMSPTTGDVLAVANYPSFNLNDLKTLQGADFNYAFQKEYEPGSTFKLVGFANAFQHRKVSPDSVIDCKYGYYREGRVIVRDDYPKGKIPTWEVFARSNNVGTYRVASRVGSTLRDKLASLKAMSLGLGFARKTGVRIPSERGGYINPEQKLGMFASQTRGYGVQVTPIQLAVAYNTVASGGERKPTRLVSSPPRDAAELTSERVLSTEAVKGLKMCLGKVTDHTGRRAKVEGLTIGGKTGTAEIFERGVKYGEAGNISSFVGMFPLEKPQFVVAVVLEKAKKGFDTDYIGGGTVAAPVFQKIASRIKDGAF